MGCIPSKRFISANNGLYSPLKSVRGSSSLYSNRNNNRVFQPETHWRNRSRRRIDSRKSGKSSIFQSSIFHSSNTSHDQKLPLNLRLELRIRSSKWMRGGKKVSQTRGHKRMWKDSRESFHVMMITVILLWLSSERHPKLNTAQPLTRELKGVKTFDHFWLISSDGLY